MKTRMTEYDINKLRSSAKEITDILYDIPEGNYDLSKEVDDYDDKTAHPVFGHDLPWQRTEDDGRNLPLNAVYIKVMENEIEVLRSRIEPQDTGHLYTTIDTLEKRVRELKEEEAVDYEGSFESCQATFPFPLDRPDYKPTRHYQSEDGC
mgnify:FL=1|tara:strand:+ start:1481 stop:1930 length:450 start_codon:yes stop_codon:yes gene_type:complete